jgi:PBS lyase HEAT-like repeat
MSTSRQVRSLIFLHPEKLFASRGCSGPPFWAGVLMWFTIDVGLLAGAGWGLLRSGALEQASPPETASLLAVDGTNTGVELYAPWFDPSQLMNVVALAGNSATTAQRQEAAGDLEKGSCCEDDAVATAAAGACCAGGEVGRPAPSAGAGGLNAIAKGPASGAAAMPSTPVPPPTSSRSSRAGSGKLIVKRLWSVSEEDLRRQLCWAPEVALNGPEWSELMRRYFESYNPSLQVSAGIYDMQLEPNLLLSVRPDLRRLPIRTDHYAGMGETSATTLTSLSQKLRQYVKQAVPHDRAGNHLDPDALRAFLSYQREWFRPQAVPVLRQLLMHEDKPLRALLVELLTAIPGYQATTVLAEEAMFDLAADVREAAVQALRKRPSSSYREILIKGLRYPWAPAADHAAEALVALGDHDAVPRLVQLLESPDPGRPVPRRDGRFELRELVRIHHATNCVICHPPAATDSDPAPGVVPGITLRLPTSATRPLRMCETDRLMVNPLLVRGDITFLRQDFSVQLPMRATSANSQSFERRFDYVVRRRILTSEQVRHQKKHFPAAGDSEQRQALLFALRELTGKNGASPQDWKVALLGGH